MRLTTCFLLSFGLLATTVSAGKLKGYMSKSSIPSSGKEWISLENGVEFQPGTEANLSAAGVRKLWGSGKSSERTIFADGTETFYDDYAQAWRLLGFYVDCDFCADESNSNAAYCIQQGQQTTCQRFLLWAAYVDEEYSGDGEGEYMYYDRQRKSWNKSACKESGSDRCARMDCHEPNTHFTLLGVFKEPDYGTFLEQLYQQQGDCVWTDEEYKAMQTSRQVLPQQCTESNNNLYYDVKPEAGGNLGIGLYKDNECIEEYEGDVTAEEILAMDGYEGSLEDDVAAWNDAFEAFKICQPCKTSDLVSLLNKDAEVNVDGDRYQHMDNADDDGFICQQAAMNQCTQFQSNTNMLTASYRDISLAEEQGTVSAVSVAGVEFGDTHRWKRRFLSALAMMASFCLLVCSFIRCQDHREEADMKRPLMGRQNRSGNGRQRNWRK